MQLSLAYSPCPNDTFIFAALATGRLGFPGHSFDIALHDVETLNQRAFAGEFDITKLSFHALLLVADRYRLLATGAALGFGCGPILVARRPMAREELSSCRIAVPGELTSAHLLLRLFAPEATSRLFTTYDQIIPLVASGRADCGVIIHESRFVYAEAGLHGVVDLGAWWEQETGLPIPLGCIAMRRSLGAQLAADFEGLVRQSIAFSRENPALARGYITEHAIEQSAAVQAQHIETFVNDFSLDLGRVGSEAVAALEVRARQAGILP